MSANGLRSVFRSRVNPASAAFRENYAAMSALVEKLRREMEAARTEGSEGAIQRHKAAGKMTARERIELLLDEDSPYLELMPLAGYGTKPIAVGGTVTAGIGVVGGAICLIIANVPTVKGGSVDRVTLQKSGRLYEIAMQNRLPTISLVESSGAHLPEQAYVFNYGGIGFRELTRRSKAGLPSISVVFGNSTAGGAYIPGMSDYVVMVKGGAKVFLAGPPLVKMATNETVDDESLGGAEMHAKISGLADYLAQNESHALLTVKRIMRRLAPSLTRAAAKTDVPPPLYPADELLGVLSPDLKKPIDVREIIARFVDGSEFDEFKPNYGPTLVTGLAEIMGWPVGILGNNGVLFSESANKAAHFIQLCNKRNIPLLFLQNTTGFMVGRAYEEGGIIKNGAKMINAVSNSETPAITLMVGATYGAGNYAMCGRAYEPRFLFSYPHAKIAVMGPEQLAGVMDIIQREAAQKAGRPYDEQQGELVKAMVKQQIENESDAFYATGQMWDDGIIDPRETRNVLGFCFGVIYNS
ncbi:MAG: carboxyl transferase domain-containing protein, partial [Bacteroidia bacterium]|nr:carboxyl transferase domain-containing protein [Bacteroidia bacterium]